VFGRTTLKELILLGVMLFGLCTVCFGQEESITITTYYPSPYGSYNELQTNRLYIGGPAQNTDQLWIERADVGDDWSEFRIGIGDNTGGDDSFVIGVVPCFTCGGNPEVWNPLFTVRNNGRVGIGTPDPQAALDMGGGGIRLGGVTRTSWPSGLGVYVGRTTAQYTGNMGGYTGANERCAAQYPGSHLCTASELLNSINQGINIDGGWAWYSTGTLMDTNTNRLVSDCSGWTQSGNFWGGHRTRGASLSPAWNWCDNPHPLMCCQ